MMTLPSKSILLIAWLCGVLQAGSYMFVHNSFVIVSDPPLMLFHCDIAKGIILSSCGMVKEALLIQIARDESIP